MNPEPGTVFQCTEFLEFLGYQALIISQDMVHWNASLPHLANINFVHSGYLYDNDLQISESVRRLMGRSSALLSFGGAGLAALLTIEFVIANTMLRHQMTPAEEVDARLVSC